eukprot:g12249.t1
MSGLWASGPSRRRSMGGGDSTKDRRPRLKALAAESAQERRRQEFISNQRRARRNLSDHARLLAALPSEESEISEIADTDTAEHSQQNHLYQHRDYSHHVHGFLSGEETGSGVVRACVGQHEGAREAGEDGMAIDDGEDIGASKAAGTVLGEGESGMGEAVNSSSSISGSRMNGRNSQGHRGKGKRGAGGGGSNAAVQRAVKRREHWANQLCTPEWMLTVPNDLNGAGSPVGAGWYVMARPEGKRVLVISANGETVARQMSGAITHRFSSNLPGGSAQGRRGGSKGGGYCILDCVFHELDHTFFVLDMMAWKGYPLYDCNADFRFYWVRTKLQEADGPLDSITSRNAYRIKPTPYHECDRQGLAHAYSSPVPFIKDGLLFHLKSAHYQLGPTPLVLLWKDASVARYLGVDSAQAVVLNVGDRCRDEGGRSEVSAQRVNPAVSGFQREGAANHAYPLLTADGVWVGEVGAEGSATYIPQVKTNELVRFKLTGAEEELVDVDQSEGGMLKAVVHGLRFDKRCSKLRPMADTWSKVLFQARLRLNSGVSVDDIDSKCLAPASLGAATAGASEKTEPPEALSGFGTNFGFASTQGHHAMGGAATPAPLDDDEML